MLPPAVLLTTFTDEPLPNTTVELLGVDVPVARAWYVVCPSVSTRMVVPSLKVSVNRTYSC